MSDRTAAIITYSVFGGATLIAVGLLAQHFLFIVGIWGISG